MQNTEQKNNNEFMIEKLKDRPVNKKKLLRKTLTTAMLAVIFGLIACVTFQLLEPVISNWLYPAPKEDQLILFPEDKEEMQPEDMLSHNISTGSKDSNGNTEPDFFFSGENGTPSAGYMNYLQIYETLAEMVNTLDKSIVTITTTKVNKDWLSNEYETKGSTTGVIIGKTGKEALILTDYSSINAANSLMCTLFNGYSSPVELKKFHTDSDVAIISLNLTAMGNYAEEVIPASFGSTVGESLMCMPVIAMGSPMGACGSVGYGMITSEGGKISMVDANYTLLTTDIYGSQYANGYLFNLKGQIIGIITDNKKSSDMRNMITAYGITDMKQLISTLSGGYDVAYLGITGIDVSEEANVQGKVPLGVYVQEMEEDSPALRAGIQKGDIIVEMNGTAIENFDEFASVFGELKAGRTITVKTMRQTLNEYTEMSFNIVLGAAK